MRLHVLRESPQKSRFAGSYLTSQDDEAPTFMNPIEEAGTRLPGNGDSCRKSVDQQQVEWFLSKNQSSRYTWDVQVLWHYLFEMDFTGYEMVSCPCAHTSMIPSNRAVSRESSGYEDCLHKEEITSMRYGTAPDLPTSHPT